MSTLLIADLHLQPSAPALTRQALALFDAARGHDALWILGDLFEAWIGDDAGAADPLAIEVGDALSALAASGTAIHLMHGNRDFLLGEAFAERAGATLHREDERVETLYGERVLLMHGDTLCTADTAYQALRATVRDPGWQARALAMSIPERVQAAQALRQGSREASGDKADTIMDVSDDAVRARLQARGVNTLVHGHTHRPNEHAVGLDEGDSARRLVVGDWHADGAAVVVAGPDGLTLTRFAAGTPLPSAG